MTKLINQNTGDVIDVADDAVANWVNSCTPWTFEDKSVQSISVRSENAIDRISVNLENCYGINRLSYQFDFSDNAAYSIYAPNGFMKTSFAKTFSDIQFDSETTDRMYPEKKTKRIVTKKNGRSLGGDSVYVIHPYDSEFEPKGVSTLLVNAELKEKYESYAKKIEESKDRILLSLKRISRLNGKSRTPRDEICDVFGIEQSGLYKFFYDSLAFVVGGEADLYANIDYKDVFNDKVSKFLNEGSVKADIRGYIENYQRLIASSTVLDRDFSHQSASDTASLLSDNGFFGAGHTVTINGEDSLVCFTKEDLDSVVENEKSRILEDTNLKKIFSSLDQKLIKNRELKGFREVLLDNQWLVSELGDWVGLKKKVWGYYLSTVRDDLEEFSRVFDSCYANMEEISNQASLEKTKWEEVVDQFNTRFYVPFKLKVGNQKNVVLDNEEPVIEFYFDDQSGSDEVLVDRSKLLDVLSLGERRALYILNVLFEIHARRVDDVETIFVVDDIADSFDYKNKYAIIEYFKELSDTKDFQFLFLTHNFDFHRTISGRLDIPGKKRLSCVKTSSELKLEEDRYQQSPFKYWRKSLSSDNRILISSIPFVRNLCEYVGGSQDFYNVLTSLLHIKENTECVKIRDLEKILKSVLGDQDSLNLQDKERLVVEVIYDEAREISTSGSDDISLENKIVMSIAIRLLAERHMINVIADPSFVDNIGVNQTAVLYKKYSDLYPENKDEIYLLTQVNLMTPENIHLNSFMYEPILDMSILHLYDLYERVSKI